MASFLPSFYFRQQPHPNRRHALPAQLHVRPHGVHGRHCAVHEPLPLPLRHRVQLHSRRRSHCHVEECRKMTLSHDHFRLCISFIAKFHRYLSSHVTFLSFKLEKYTLWLACSTDITLHASNKKHFCSLKHKKVAGLAHEMVRLVTFSIILSLAFVKCASPI